MNFGFNFKSRKFEHKSYSQSGEDLIVKFIFNAIGIKKPSYWDIGAYHPYKISNTALFYETGSRGLNMEPNPDLFRLFLDARSEDVNINMGIATVAGEGIFYCLDIPTLNTFSKEDADNSVREGHVLKDKKSLKLITPQEVSSDYFGGKWPDFLTLDVEGVGLSLLDKFSYHDEALKVVCVETISYSTTGRGVKDQEIIKFMEEKGYLFYADTNINSIFVKKSYWYK